MAKDFAAFGCTQEQIDAAYGGDEAEEDADLFEVYPCNWDAATVFWSLTTRWQLNGLNGRHEGFTRPDIESTLHLMQIKRRLQRGIFEDLMVMERAALEVLNRGE